MIYTDGIHMISDQSIEKLHAFAMSMDLKRCWFHNPRGRGHPHYDLVRSGALDAAIEHGAICISSLDLVSITTEVYS